MEPILVMMSFPRLTCFLLCRLSVFVSIDSFYSSLFIFIIYSVLFCFSFLFLLLYHPSLLHQFLHPFVLSSSSSSHFPFTFSLLFFLHSPELLPSFFSSSVSLVAVALRNQKVRITGGNGQVTEVSDSVSMPTLSQLTLCFEVERTNQKQVCFLSAAR